MQQGGKMYKVRAVQECVIFSKMLIYLLILTCVIIGFFPNKAYCYESEGKISQEERVAIENQGYLGIIYTEPDTKDKAGILVTYIRMDGPAEKAGLKVNDLILDIDGQIIDKESFNKFMGKTKAGQEVTFTIMKNGKKRTITITLAKLPPENVQARLKNRLGKSWWDKTNEAWADKDWNKAIRYYEKWLEVVPQNKNAWYFLACVYTLNNEKEKALEAWAFAVDAGWDDIEYAQKDENLELIRSEKRFQKSLERCANNKYVSAPKDFIQNYIEMKSLGTYIALLPPDYDESKIEYSLCLILHGHGSTEYEHGTLGDDVGREGVIYIVPRYPYPHMEIIKNWQKPGWTGWPPYDFGENESLFPTIDKLNIDWIFACATDAKEHYRILGDKVSILGHSQGAFLSIACAASHPELVKSYFAYAGFVPDVYLGKEFLNGLKEHNVKVYLAHGTEDKVVDPNESKKAEKAMEEAGVDCVLRMFKAKHRFTGQIYSYAKEWLDTEVRANKN